MGDFLKEIENRILVHDGSKGYLLQKFGLKGNECGELWNLTNPGTVRKVYRSYIEAGSDVIQTNTFPGNLVHLQKYSLEDKVYEINFQGAKLAREEAGDSIFVCASIGPSGLLFEPSGELTFDKSYEIYCQQVKAVADGGADVINFETFTDLAELRAALLAAKDTTNLPVICSLAFESSGRTLMGTDPYVAAVVLKSLGADLAGTNCSFGPEHMLDIVKMMYEAGGGNLSVKPNAGIPQMIGGCVRYEETAEHFAERTSQFVKYGARLLGGCCGSTPEFIKALKSRVANLEPVPVKNRTKSLITSNVKCIDADQLKQENLGVMKLLSGTELYSALIRNDRAYLEDAALDMASEGYDAIYVHYDGENGDAGLLPGLINVLQGYVKEPVIIETRSVAALDSTLRIYRGIAGVVIHSDSDALEAELKKTASKYGSYVIHNRPFL